MTKKPGDSLFIFEKTTRQWLDACFCLYCSSSGNKIYSVVWSCVSICSYQITRTVGHSSSRKTSLCSINFVSLCFHICRGSVVFPRGKNWLRIYLVFRAESIPRGKQRRSPLI